MVEAADQPGIATMGERGQVVIPKHLRDQLGLPPQTRFVVYARGDVIVLKRLDLPDIEEEWEAILEAVDRKALDLSPKQVRKEIQALREERRADPET